MVLLDAGVVAAGLVLLDAGVVTAGLVLLVTAQSLVALPPLV